LQKATVLLLDVAEPMHDWLDAAFTAISGSLVAKASGSSRHHRLHGSAF
jgi:hypothetical protein